MARDGPRASRRSGPGADKGRRGPAGNSAARGAGAGGGGAYHADVPGTFRSDVVDGPEVGHRLATPSQRLHGGNKQIFNALQASDNSTFNSETDPTQSRNSSSHADMHSEECGSTSARCGGGAAAAASAAAGRNTIRARGAGQPLEGGTAGTTLVAKPKPQATCGLVLNMNADARGGHIAPFYTDNANVLKATEQHAVPRPQAATACTAMPPGVVHPPQEDPWRDPTQRGGEQPELRGRGFSPAYGSRGSATPLAAPPNLTGGHLLGRGASGEYSRRGDDPRAEPPHGNGRWVGSARHSNGPTRGRSGGSHDHWGTVKSHDPDEAQEEARQKTLKGLLNKITPTNSSTILAKILALEVASKKTLRGFIEQVFEKALVEPTFCATYARLCRDLGRALADAGAGMADLRLLLLNKCQQEFELYDAAIRTASAREGAAAAAAEMQLARRRALGNVKLIGELFKEAMVAKAVVMRCVDTLMGTAGVPSPESLECLAGLLTTVGTALEPADQRGNPRRCAKLDLMFPRIAQLARSDQLDSRIRFLLLNLMELRARLWRPRREVEVPRALGGIHDLSLGQAAHGPRDFTAPPPCHGPLPRNYCGSWQQPAAPQRGPPPSRAGAPPSATWGAPMQDYTNPAMPPRAPPSGGTYAPSRAAARAPGFPNPAAPRRAGGMGAPEQTSPPRMEPLRQDAAPAAPAAVRTPPLNAQAAHEPAATIDSLEVLRRAKGLAAEYFSSNDAAELRLSVTELSARGADMALIFDGFFMQAVEQGGLDADARTQNLTALVLCVSGLDPEIVTRAALERGVAAALATLASGVLDAPQAPALAGAAMGALVAAGRMDLARVCAAVLAAVGPEEEPAAPGEDSELIASGAALEIVGACLRRVTAERGDAAAAAAWRATGLNVLSFAPTFECEAPGMASALLSRLGLQALAAPAVASPSAASDDAEQAVVAAEAAAAGKDAEVVKPAADVASARAACQAAAEGATELPALPDDSAPAAAEAVTEVAALPAPNDVACEGLGEAVGEAAGGPQLPAAPAAPQAAAEFPAPPAPEDLAGGAQGEALGEAAGGPQLPAAPAAPPAVAEFAVPPAPEDLAGEGGNMGAAAEVAQPPAAPAAAPAEAARMGPFGGLGPIFGTMPLLAAAVHVAAPNVAKLVTCLALHGWIAVGLVGRGATGLGAAAARATANEINKWGDTDGREEDTDEGVQEDDLYFNRDTSRVVARVLTARAAQKILLQLQETDLYVHRWFGEFCMENPPNQGDDFLLKLMRARTEAIHEATTSKRHLINPQALARRIMIVRESLATALTGPGLPQFLARANLEVQRRHLESSSYTSASWGKPQRAEKSGRRPTP
ncbi:hypothetical protein WJX81_005155 [Elliptochloris bilobata]|uniref:MI domain-containing protein n=1 Tax=Elliptochloris bilobata TaxID=381761 RepID=A0AAW1RKJ5_9CHLO